MVPLVALVAASVPFPVEAAVIEARRVLAALEFKGPYRFMGAHRDGGANWVVTMEEADGGPCEVRVSYRSRRVDHLVRYDPGMKTFGGRLAPALVRETDRWLANLHPRLPVRSWPLNYSATFRGFGTYVQGRPFLQPNNLGYRFALDPSGRLLVYDANEDVSQVPKITPKLGAAEAVRRATAILTASDVAPFPKTLRISPRPTSLGWVWNYHDPVALVWGVGYSVHSPGSRFAIPGRLYVDAVTGKRVLP